MTHTYLTAFLMAGGAMSAGAQAAAVGDTAVPIVSDGESGSPFGVAGHLGDRALGAITGMADVQLEEQIASARNTSVVAGNSVNGLVVTGEISIDGQSFQNVAGLSILTANTGNNVSVNAAMNVNVSIHQ